MQVARVYLVALALICPSFAGSPAFADPPWPPANSTIPGHVTLVCLGPAGPDIVLGRCSVTLRDLANNPVMGSVVTFDFSNCFDMRIAADQHDPRLTVNCATRTVSAMTDLNGVALFTVIGTGIGGPASPSSALKIYADGVLLGGVSVAVLDRDGVGGLTGMDLAQWAGDLWAGTNPARADLDGNGVVNGGDLSRFAAAFFNGNNVLSAGTICP
jgi:hypothetical protein